MKYLRQRYLNLLRLGAFLQSFFLIAVSLSVVHFSHVHIYNGERVVHSHPFSPSADHTHSYAVAVALEAMSSFQADVYEGVSFDQPLGCVLFLYADVAVRASCAESLYAFYCRPPPSFVF